VTARGVRLLAAALAVAVAGCGTDGGGGPSSWSSARVSGVANASDVAVDGDVLLIVASGDDRRLHVVPRPDLRDGGVATARSLPFEVRPEARLVGADEFAGVGYPAADLWAQPGDFQGVATHPPDRLYVADRAYRVVYAGRLRLGADRRPAAASLDLVFALPGADRKGRTRSDWRDAGPGLAGLTTFPEGRRAEDLYAVEVRGASRHETRIWRMDRFGQSGTWFGVSFPDEPDADVGGIAPDGDRFLVVRGAGRGTVASVPEGAWARTTPLELGEPGPAPPSGSSWRGIARATDGTVYLVSSGSECRVAWRRATPR
jgi:hypothetical protein